MPAFQLAEEWNLIIENMPAFQPAEEWNLIIENMPAFQPAEEWNLIIENMPAFQPAKEWNLIIENMPAFQPARVELDNREYARPSSRQKSGTSKKRICWPSSQHKHKKIAACCGK